MLSQARQFAIQYAANAANNMLKTIDMIGKNSGRITTIAIVVSTPHQIGFILTLALPYMEWGWTNPKTLESLTMILLAGGVPVATDLLILNCIKIIGAVAASQKSKNLAMRIILFPVLASGTVNVLAPAPMLLRCLAGFIVTVIPMSEALRAYLKPDFAKIEAMENEIVAQVTPVAEVARMQRKTNTSRERVAHILALAPDATYREIAKRAGLTYETARVHAKKLRHEATVTATATA